MRVGLVIYGSLDTISGGYLYDRKLVETLEAAGDDVTVISLPWQNYAAHLTHNYSTRFFAQMRAGFDVLVQDELNHPSLFRLNRRLRRVSETPVVSIVHHLRSSEERAAWQNDLYRVVEKRYLQTVDGFIYNSRTTQGTVEVLVGAERPSVVAYPGKDGPGPPLSVEEIGARCTRGGPLHLLFVGNLIKRKGLHTLIAALGRMPDVDWRLTVIGNRDSDPAYTARIETAVRAAGIEARCEMTGSMSNRALAEQYAAHDVLVVPSSYEGFGIVYVEAMAAGLPVIGTRVGAAPELIEDGKSGYLIVPGDAEGLQGYLRGLAADRDLLRAMSLRARHAYDGFPGWDESMASARRFLTQMIRPTK